MKIGLPKLRFSRKLLIITLGITVLLGGTGMTALYFGGESLMMEGGENAVGGECTDVQTMVVKTPSNHLWLRKFIRMENASGHDRVRTALRIAGNLSKKNAVDLIHVSVLDTHGPTKRADMRSRAIGAEVLIALKPDNLPEMKSPAMASYYEGPVSDEGRYYGDRVVMDIEEIGAMMTAMRTVEEKPDCIAPVVEAKEAPNDGHGKKDENEGHAKPNDHGEKPAEAHGEQPANEHGEKPAEAHGEEPAKEGDTAGGHDAATPKEQSFLDSMMSMVGLGGSEEPAAETHEPASEESADAPAGGHDLAKSTEGHDKKPADAKHEATEAEPAADGHAKPANYEAVAEEPTEAADQPHEAKTDNTGHETEQAASDEHAAEEPKPAEDHAASEKPKQAVEKPTDAHESSEAVESQDKKPAAEAEHEATDAKPVPAAEDQAELTDEAHAPPPAEDDHAAEVAPDTEDKAAAHDTKPAKVDAHAPADGKSPDGKKKPKADEHAEADKPADH